MTTQVNKAVNQRSRGLLLLVLLVIMLPVLLYGVIANRVMERFRNGSRATMLIELVDAKATAIQLWLAREQTIVQSWADSARVRELVGELIEIAAKAGPDQSPSALRDALQQSLLKQEMETLANHPVHVAIWDSRFVTITDWSPERLGIGVGITPKGAERLTAILQGRAKAFVIGPEDAITIDNFELPKKPILGTMVPVSDGSGMVIAAMLVYDPGVEEALAEFVRLSPGAEQPESVARTFVFDRSGMLLYDSPYDPQLQKLGLLPDAAESRSAKRLILRDPGVNLTQVDLPVEPMARQPPTKMVRMAVGEGAGFDVDGYRDVRGVMVAGAWRWLDDYQFGIGIEIDRDTVQPELWLAQLQSWVMLGLLVASFGVVGYLLLEIRRLRNQVQSKDSS